METREDGEGTIGTCGESPDAASSRSSWSIRLCTKSYSMSGSILGLTFQLVLRGGTGEVEDRAMRGRKMNQKRFEQID